MITEYKKMFLNMILLVLFFDLLGFIFWSLSGQYPADSFYIGAITKNIISIIL